MKRALGAAAVLLATVLAATALPAQQPKDRVARVSLSQGEMSYQRGDDTQWNALGANTPLMTGDSLYAAQGSRAEVDLGGGNSVRLDNATDLDILNLSEDVTQLGMSQGNANVRVRSLPGNGSVEMDTPLAAATLWEPGQYRVGMDGENATFGVVSGRLSVALNGEQLDVREGEVLELQGGAGARYAYSRLPRDNDFDRWSEDRDDRRRQSPSSRYVNSSVMGYEDLDDQGTWRQDNQYGNVWYPSHVSNDWAPYRSGRWIWQDPYGWTWVSYEPWGWAPYHYGRWVHMRRGWAWIPPPPHGYRGPRAVMNIQPYYSPSLVAFIGGSNWSIGVSIGGGGHIGWVPLGPSDPYRYAWQRPVPVTNVVYQNIYIDNSVTVVNYNNFRSGPVHHIAVDRDVVRGAPVMGSRPERIVPDRASLAPYPNEKRGVRAPPVRERPFVVRNMPPPKAVPFADKLPEIEKTGRPYEKSGGQDDRVGKPFQRGMTAPAGVRAKPALAPEGGTRAPKLTPRPGQEDRRARPIERDVVKPSADPRRAQGPSERPPAEKTSGREQPNQSRPTVEGQSGSRPGAPPHRDAQAPAAAEERRAQPPKREPPSPAEPRYQNPEQPKRDAPPPAEPAARRPEQPKREAPPPAEADTRQPQPPKPEGPHSREPGYIQPQDPKQDTQGMPQAKPQAPPLTPEEKRRAEELRKAEEKRLAEEAKAASRGHK